MITATTEISSNEWELLAREVAADKYDQEWPTRTTMGDLAREGFIAGWNAAMEYVEKERGTPSNVPNQEQANTDSSFANRA